MPQIRDANDEASRMSRLLWILLGAFLVLIAAVVVVDRVIHSAPPQTVAQVDQAVPPAITDSATGNRIGDKAPDFTFKTIDGRTVSLSDYRGKNVVLNFWATWCGPCRYEISTIEALYEATADKDVVVLGVNVQDSMDNAASYAQAYGLKFTIPVDAPGQSVRLFGLHGIPTTFFIGRDGIIAAIKVGPFLSLDEAEQMLSSFK